MASAEFSSPLRKYKLVFLGEQSGKMATLVVCRQNVDFYPPSRKDISHYSFHVRYFRQYISSKLRKYVDMPSYKRFFLSRLLSVSISYRKQCIWKTKLCVCNYVSLCSMLYFFFFFFFCNVLIFLIS